MRQENLPSNNSNNRAESRSVPEYSATEFIPLMHQPAPGMRFYIVKKRGWKCPDYMTDRFGGCYWQGDASSPADAIRRAKQARVRLTRSATRKERGR